MTRPGILLLDEPTVGLDPLMEAEFQALAREAADRGHIASPSGYLGLTFLFFVLALSLFAAAQVASARHEEMAQRLETLLALPVGRRGWLTGRLLLAAACAAALALLAGVLAWAGAASQGASVSLADMLAAGANCLPAVLLFLGVAALGFAIAPRASS